MTRQEVDDFQATVLVSAFSVAIAIAVLALVVAIVSGGGDTYEPGVTGHDLRLAFTHCEPFNATFEQTVACTQAVYAGADQ